MNPRRLYRSRDRQLAGVAGGMAEYLDVDPTVIRILWILATIFTGGLLLLAYIVLAFVMPEAPRVPAGYPGYPGAAPAGYPAGAASTGWAPPAPAATAWSPDWAASAAVETQARQRSGNRGFGAAAIVGVVLIVIGAIALADAAFPGWSGAVILGPAVIIALGAALLVASVRRREEPTAMPASPVAPAAAAPVTDPAPAPNAAWDGTDTQAVDPATFGTADADPEAGRA